MSNIKSATGGRLTFLLLLLAFTLLPLFEFTLLLWINSQIGLCMTITFVLGTGFLGAALAKWQGLFIWRQIIQEVSQGRTPTNPMIDGVLTLVASILLITPGVLTDITGILMLFSPTRFLIRELLKREFLKHVKLHIQTHSTQFTPAETNEPLDDSNIIDAEYKVVQPRKRIRKLKNIDRPPTDNKE